MKQRLSTRDQRTETILLERKAWLTHGQPFLAELQECVISPEAMPMERNATAWKPATCPSPLPHCSLSSTEPGIACCLCTCRTGSSVPPLWPRTPGFQVASLHTFGRIGKRALYALSGRIQLKANSRMSSSLAFYLMFMSSNLLVTFMEHLLDARYWVGSFKRRREKALLGSCLPSSGEDAQVRMFSRT